MALVEVKVVLNTSSEIKEIQDILNLFNDIPEGSNKEAEQTKAVMTYLLGHFNRSKKVQETYVQLKMKSDEQAQLIQELEVNNETVSKQLLAMRNTNNGLMKEMGDFDVQLHELLTENRGLKNTIRHLQEDLEQSKEKTEGHFTDSDLIETVTGKSKEEHLTVESETIDKAEELVGRLTSLVEVQSGLIVEQSKVNQQTILGMSDKFTQAVVDVAVAVAGKQAQQMPMPVAVPMQFQSGQIPIQENTPFNREQSEELARQVAVTTEEKAKEPVEETIEEETIEEEVDDFPMDEGDDFAVGGGQLSLEDITAIQRKLGGE